MLMQATPMTQRVQTPNVAARLRSCASDPMWADHCEISKKTALDAADLIVSLVEELCHAQREASGCNAELYSTTEGDTKYAVRDARLASQRLSNLQDRIRSFLGEVA